MVQLTKKKATSWRGNGMGTDSAEWIVKGAEHITVLQLSSGWVARDDSTRKEHGISRIVARADYKRDLVEKLSQLSF